MIQIALIITFDERIEDACLFNVLDSYMNLGLKIRQVHTEVLAQSVNIPRNDPAALERIRAWTETFEGIDHAEVQRGMDIMKLAHMERGEAPPDRAF